ncbi:MAG TPA: hypothetical protein VIX73_23470 [Kofleriaceae bacterium]|jgi:hypothetical protein
MMCSNSRSLSFVAAVALAAAPLAAGCAEATPALETGDLLVQLTQPGPHGEIYHLGNATFDIVNLESGTTTTVDGGGVDAQVNVSLPPGLANVTLRDGWTLEKSTDGGATFAPVSALLGSPNPNVIRVLANQLAFMEFAFLIRQTNGTLGITLGVVTNPRELAGGVLIDTATDELAAYATGGNRTFDFGLFFNLFSLESVTLDDGTKQHVYTAFGQGGSFGPFPQPTAALGSEFYNDSLGTYSGPIAHELTGGSLTYTVAALPDGTIQLSGSLVGGATDIEFGPSPIDAVIPPIGADGFPADVFFYNSTVPFTQTSAQGTVTGTLRIRQFLETP